MRIDPTMLSPLPIAEAWWPRFVAKIAVAENGCWHWTASIHPDGYGRFGISNRIQPAHRVAYRSLRGEIPAGLSIDHVCHNEDKTCPGAQECLHRRCVNPWHMDAVTNAENVLRGHSQMAQQARSSTCKRGHKLSGSNLYQTPAGRHCKTCRLAANRKFHARRGPLPAKPSKAQIRVLETLQSGGSIRQEDWRTFLLCRVDGEPICRLSTGTPASLVKRGWAVGPDVLSLQVTDAGARFLEGQGA